MIQNEVYYSPLVVNVEGTFQAIGTNVTAGGGAGATLRFGIYADNGSGSPGRLLLDSGPVAATGTGAISEAISQVLLPGVYWLAVVAQGSASTPTIEALYGGNPLVGMINLTDGNIAGYGQTGVAGALPASALVTADVNPDALVGLQAL